MTARPCLSPRREIGSSARWRTPDEVPAPESQVLTHRGVRQFREGPLVRTRGTLPSRRRGTEHRVRTCLSRPPPHPRLRRSSRWLLDHRCLRASFPTSWISWDQLHVYRTCTRPPHHRVRDSPDRRWTGPEQLPSRRCVGTNEADGTSRGLRNLSDGCRD